MRCLVSVSVVLLCACTPHVAPQPQPRATHATVKSNVTRADYAGSQACVSCHSDETATFLRSPMHNMTREIRGAAIRAPFGGEHFRFKDDEVVLTQAGGERYATLVSQTQGTKIFRISRVIGGRHREDFAGIEVNAPGGAVVGAGLERILPMTYVFAERTYRYKGYSVMTPERPGMRPGAVWQKTCIFCHNTEPFLDTALGAVTAKRSPYQGEVVDALLPEARREPLVVDKMAFRTALDAEMKVLGALALGDKPIDALALDAITAIRRRFDARNSIETGIGCESCHLGSKEHVEHKETKPSFAPRGALSVAALADPEAARARDINHACARCHQVLFTGYAFTWEGGRRSDALPGGSHISSGEGRDFLLGRCATKLHCARCHDPHAADGDEQRAKTDGLPGNKLCLECHDKYAAPEALRAHSHHDPQKAGASCMDCHMPKKNMSLDMKLSRYHRIGSPNDPERVERDRPLECALCHADKSVGELVGKMSEWWGKRYDEAALQSLYGSLEANTLMATLINGKPHEQAVAMFTLGRAKRLDAARLIASQLTHTYPILRFYARDALAQLLGNFEVNLNQANEAITSAANVRLTSAGIRPVSAHAAPATPNAVDED